ncbi:MAG: response regulator transcription factor [Candidatus Eremiobacteraeota bacterium]|nr:response regulator transcription factor [Candidatus Eremiobacteraeota bacterium]MBC5826906.1 response regulator transcription factor [Candidatus Eremiobacteraeota bacterium]
MPQGSKVLVVDDERSIRDMLRMGLEQHGYAVRWLTDGRGLDVTISEWQPDAILLDVMMPYADGFTLLPMIRRQTQAPVIMLTAKGEVDDRVTGLTLGADDYMPKPFAFAELVSRLEACLRRPHISAPAHLQYDDLSVDLKTREVRRAGRPIALTNKEFTLLVTLMREPRRVFGKEELLTLVWGVDFEGEIGNVETYISYLRSKIDADSPRRLIHTLRGAGYSLRGGN